jgi:protein-tyrosine phosphatase
VVCLLSPYLFGARLNVLWWGRHGNASDEIAPGVWLGRRPRRQDRDRTGIASLVDLVAELPVDIEGVGYRSVPMLDMVVPTVVQLNRAVRAIDDLSEMRPTLVFCAVGYSRSAATVAAWLIASGKATSVDEAIVQIRTRRPRIVLGTEHRARLEEWHRCRTA